MNWNDQVSVYLLIGSAFYLVGGFLVTAAFNVPRNNFLETIDPKDSDNAKIWTGFYSRWIVWNHVRTVASLVAAVLLTLSLCY